MNTGGGCLGGIIGFLVGGSIGWVVASSINQPFALVVGMVMGFSAGSFVGDAIGRSRGRPTQPTPPPSAQARGSKQVDRLIAAPADTPKALNDDSIRLLAQQPLNPPKIGTKNHALERARQVHAYLHPLAIRDAFNPPVTEIEPGLYLGGRPTAQFPKVLSVLNVADVSDEARADGYYSMPIHDGEPFPGIGWLEKATSIVDACLQNGQSILVHGDAGISRSAMVVVAYLMKRDGSSVDDALDHVLGKRSIAPSPEFLVGLMDWETHLLQDSPPPPLKRPEVPVSFLPGHKLLTDVPRKPKHDPEKETNQVQAIRYAMKHIGEWPVFNPETGEFLGWEPLETPSAQVEVKQQPTGPALIQPPPIATPPEQPQPNADMGQAFQAHGKEMITAFTRVQMHQLASDLLTHSNPEYASLWRAASDGQQEGLVNLLTRLTAGQSDLKDRDRRDFDEFKQWLEANAQGSIPSFIRSELQARGR